MLHRSRARRAGLDRSPDAAFRREWARERLRSPEGRVTEEEQVKLTLAINIINSWNRIAVGFGVWVDAAEIKASAKAAAA